MSILIKGMEMPKTCCQCDLKIYDPEKRWDENGIEQIGAWVCKRTREIIWNTQRGEKCPLVPLPEKHGRLIDADTLIENHFSDEHRIALSPANKLWMRRIIKGEPTIIEAEGGSGDG